MPTVFAEMKRQKTRRGRKILRSEEFRRVEALPRRAQFKDYSGLLTKELRTPNGEQTLRVNQGWALAEAAQERGLVFIAPVGEGKTLVSFLLGAVWEVEWVLLVVPANAVVKTSREMAEARRHWSFPPVEVVTYEKLAQKARANYLLEHCPPAIVCDEVHKIRRRNTVRRRLARFLTEYPDALFGGLSGTLVEESVKDYAHVLNFALGAQCPVPRTSDLEDWADLIDEEVPEENRPEPGAFERLCNDGESCRSAFRRRLIETPGVVAVMNPTAVGASLIIREARPEVPARVRKAIERMRRRWATPSDDIILTNIEFSRHARELALGFYYRWNWPDGKPDHEWLEARKAWRAYVRHIIRYHNRGDRAYDTELQVREAVEAGILVPDEDQYNGWFKIADRHDVESLKETVWISDFMVKWGLDWLKKAEAHKNSQAGKEARAGAGILWVGHRALLKAFKDAGAIVYGGGDNGILEERHSCVASLAAHGIVKNLQHQFSQNAFLCVPRNNLVWSQSIGRTHRTGQLADEVTVDIPLHVLELWEAFQGARARAVYQEETTAVKQKLSYAQIDVSSPDEVLRRANNKDPLWVKELDWDEGAGK